MIACHIKFLNEITNAYLFILFYFSKWNAFYSLTDIYVLYFIPFLITVLKFCVMVSGFIYDLYKLVTRPNDLIL